MMAIAFIKSANVIEEIATLTNQLKYEHTKGVEDE